MSAAVSLRDVSKTFTVKGREIEAVRSVSLEVEPGDIFGIIGSSGAGKSTLVRLINGLEEVTSGEVSVFGTEISSLGERELRRARLGIGMIFQSFNLFRSRSVAGNVEYPLIVAGVGRAERRARVAELLGFVGLTDRAGAYPDQLSGGQRQRVGIARALATSPRLLLADEATSALDAETTREVLELLRRVNRELGVTIVLITHEIDAVRAICNRVAVMAEGRIIEEGSAYEVFSAPQQPLTSSFVASALHLDTDDLARLRAAHGGRLVEVTLGEGVRIASALAYAAAEGVEVEIVHGGVQTVDERSFGRLTLALAGDEDATARVIDRFAAITDVVDLDRAEGQAIGVAETGAGS